MLGYGATRIKIALNATAGPVFSDALLATVVEQAHSAGLPVVAHLEGAGQTVRALGAGVDSLAHTPWSESLGDDLIAALAATVSICSTLDIHGFGSYGDDYAVASDNLARFSASGGRVLYGTDLGNGEQPVGLNPRELDALVAAGLPLDALVSALVSAGRSYIDRITWIPSAVPSDPAAASSWLSSATVLSVPQLKETFA
jgi:imidazolonepropionase-like amidohydrolase